MGLRIKDVEKRFDERLQERIEPETPARLCRRMFYSREKEILTLFAEKGSFAPIRKYIEADSGIKVAAGVFYRQLWHWLASNKLPCNKSELFQFLRSNGVGLSIPNTQPIVDVKPVVNGDYKKAPTQTHKKTIREPQHVSQNSVDADRRADLLRRLKMPSAQEAIRKKMIEDNEKADS